MKEKARSISRNDDWGETREAVSAVSLFHVDTCSDCRLLTKLQRQEMENYPIVKLQHVWRICVKIECFECHLF